MKISENEYVCQKCGKSAPKTKSGYVNIANHETDCISKSEANNDQDLRQIIFGLEKRVKLLESQLMGEERKPNVEEIFEGGNEEAPQEPQKKK